MESEPVADRARVIAEQRYGLGGLHASRVDAFVKGAGWAAALSDTAAPEAAETPPANATLTEDERDSLYRLAEDLIKHRGRDAYDGRLILRLLDPTQRAAPPDDRDPA